jgi:DNA repair protein RadC
MQKQNTKIGHYARLRQRFLHNGLDGFLDYEVIELLLKLADHRRDQKPTAKRLLKKFKNLRGVLEASPKQLLDIDGIGQSNIFGLKLIQSTANRYLKEKVIDADFISSSPDVLRYLKHELSGCNREVFKIILLNGRNQIQSMETLFEGTLTTSAVYPREVIKLIIEKDSAAVIFVHNHPSGNPNPSQDDIKITKKLQQACANIDVTVHDHFIIAGDEVTSFADSGLL